jgi:hypothetical protein
VTKRFGDLVGGGTAPKPAMPDTFDGVSLVHSLAARYKVAPKAIFEALAGTGILARIGRDIVALDKDELNGIIASSTRRGPRPKYDNNKPLFVFYLDRKREDADISNAKTAALWLEHNPADLRDVETVATQIRRLRKRWALHELYNY